MDGIEKLKEDNYRREAKQKAFGTENMKVLVDKDWGLSE